MRPELSDIDTCEPELLIEGVTEIESDLPPEYCHYRDEGCELADSCLHCPLPQCIYDQPRGRQRWLKKLRAKEMARLFTTKDKGIKELAEMFGVSQRTVQRALKIDRDELAMRGATKNE